MSEETVDPALVVESDVEAVAEDVTEAEETVDANLEADADESEDDLEADADESEDEEDFYVPPLPNPWRAARSWEDVVALAIGHHVDEDPAEIPGAPVNERMVALPAEGVEAIEHLAQFGLLPLAVYPVAADTGTTMQRAAITFLAPLSAYSVLNKHLLQSPLLMVCDPDTPRVPITVTNGSVKEAIQKVPDGLLDWFYDEWKPLLHRDAYKHLSRARRVHVIDLDPNEPTRLWELLSAIPGKITDNSEE